MIDLASLIEMNDIKLAIDKIIDIARNLPENKRIILRKSLDSDTGRLFKQIVLNYVYWNYYFWDKSPTFILKTLYEKWKDVLKHCILCDERENIRKCNVINSEFAYVCKLHCRGSKRWKAPVKGRLSTFSIEYCMFNRKPVSCKKPCW